MENSPSVLPGNWVTVGPNRAVKAVVCRVYDGVGITGKIEVVYLDSKNQAINEDVKWMDGHWDFCMSSGGYADNYSRLQRFVQILREGSTRRKTLPEEDGRLGAVLGIRGEDSQISISQRFMISVSSGNFRPT